MTRTFGTRAAAAVTAGLMALTVSAAPALAEMYNPSAGDQTGTGQTDLTMVLKNGTDAFGGTETFQNPDEDGDGLGDNLAFTVPSAINYVVRANGQLIGPSEGVAHIDNESVFPVEVDSVLFNPRRDFNVVEDARSSNRVNAVDLQVGPAQDMLQMSDYKNKHVVGDPTQWRMSAKGTGDGSQVPLKSAGDVANLDVDVTSRTTFGKIHWYVSPTYSLSHGVTVNYEFTNYDNETFSGQKTLYKLHWDESPVTDILPELASDSQSTSMTVEFDGQTYSGYDWSDMILTVVSGLDSNPRLNLADLDGKTITVRGRFSSVSKPETYEGGITFNYEAVDLRTGTSTRGKKVFYEIDTDYSIWYDLLPPDVNVSLKDPMASPLVRLTYNGKVYEGDSWHDMVLVSPADDPGIYTEVLDIAELEGKTVDVAMSFTSSVPPVTYTQGVTLQYELVNQTSNETLTGTVVVNEINPTSQPLESLPVPADISWRSVNVSVGHGNDTYVGDAWNELRRDGAPDESLRLEDLDGETLVLRGSFSTMNWS